MDIGENEEDMPVQYPIPVSPRRKVVEEPSPEVVPEQVPEKV